MLFAPQFFKTLVLLKVFSLLTQSAYYTLNYKFLNGLKIFSLFLLMFIGLFVSSNALSLPKQLPVKAFASLPEVSQMSLSPDGENVLSLVRIDRTDTQGVAVKLANIKTGETKVPLYAENRRFKIRWAKWASNTHLLVSAIYPSVRGGNGTPTTETRLLIVDTKTGKYRNALPSKKFDISENNSSTDAVHIPQVQDNVIDLLPDDKNKFLLSVDSLSPGWDSVFKVSLDRKKAFRIQKERRNVRDWITDQQHNVRIGLYSIDTTHKVLHKFPKSKKMTILWEYESFSEDMVRPLGFAKDQNKLYVQAYHEGRKAIFLVDVTDPELKKELIHSSKTNDIGGPLIYSHITNDVIGLGTTFWDEKYKAFQRSVDKALPNADNDIVSFSKDEQRYIVYSTSDNSPGTYYLGMRDKKSLNPIAYEYPMLSPEVIAEKKKISYKARDGLDINGYLTLPVGSVAEQRHPTIILPHGGPIASDSHHFDYWVQFFANRGYAVLQMNYRGSSGYGLEFMRSGLKSWGLSMQDDVEDGARWAIAEGYANPNKMCIVGGSYGGYAALMGAVKTPELYQCVISVAGVSDIATYVKSFDGFRNYERVKKQVGSDFSELKKRSPYYSAEKINVPTLLIHGTKDRSVAVQQSQKMYKKLLKENKPVAYLELEGGDHHLSNNGQRVEVFEAMGEFLAKYLQ